MLTPRGNVHYSNSKLPQLGAIARIVGLATVDLHQNCIVGHYTLCDNVLPYSRGIHTIYVRFLDNREIARFGSFWFEEVP
jgi:hypothetical protein